jgi:hypothetical protein
MFSLFPQSSGWGGLAATEDDRFLWWYLDFLSAQINTIMATSLNKKQISMGPRTAKLPHIFKHLMWTLRPYISWGKAGLFHCTNRYRFCIIRLLIPFVIPPSSNSIRELLEEHTKSRYRTPPYTQTVCTARLRVQSPFPSTPHANHKP